MHKHDGLFEAVRFYIRVYREQQELLCPGIEVTLNNTQMVLMYSLMKRCECFHDANPGPTFPL